MVFETTGCEMASRSAALAMLRVSPKFLLRFLSAHSKLNREGEDHFDPPGAFSSHPPRSNSGIYSNWRLGDGLRDYCDFSLTAERD
jgi:hypothetical protein